MTGSCNVEVDDEGRFAFPEPWRLEMGDRVVVLPDGKRLRIIPEHVLMARLSAMRERALTDPAVMQALSVIGRHSELCEVVAGRVTIGREHLMRAGVAQKAVLTGVDSEIKLSAITLDKGLSDETT